MTKIPNSKTYDLDERTKNFAKLCRDYLKSLAQNSTNREYSKQLARSSGSVAANYIEASEALSKKDFYYRIKICRKEAKESQLWIELTTPSNNQEAVQARLKQESIELRKIFGSIVSKGS